MPLAVNFKMAVRVARRRHSVAFLDADGTDDFAFRRNNVVFAGLGGNLARSQLIHYRVFPPRYYFVEFSGNYTSEVKPVSRRSLRVAE